VAAAARAEVYTDSKARFRVTVPDGWTREKDTTDDSLDVTSPNLKETFGQCSVHTTHAPGTEQLSQERIDQALLNRFTPAYWRKNLEGGGFKNVVIAESGVEIQNGRNTHYAIVTYELLRRAHKAKMGGAHGSGTATPAELQRLP